MKLSTEKDKRLKALAKKKDADIDYSDIPETDAMFWADAKITMPPSKKPISIRIDTDILEWFRCKEGRKYQTYINAVLRSYVEAKQLQE